LKLGMIRPKAATAAMAAGSPRSVRCVCVEDK
jgi:hypothetical protein